jgi:hypothetical protein
MGESGVKTPIINQNQSNRYVLPVRLCAHETSVTFFFQFQTILRNFQDKRIEI